MRGIGNRNRRGVVLVLVVGILAILMLMATTLVLLARVELRTSKAYQQDRVLKTIIGAMRFYCIIVLQDDKFGGDGAPYNYEKLAGSGAMLTAALTAGEYPDRYRNDGLAGDDEGFDSPSVEEWMPGTEDWRLFSGPDNDAELFDTTGPAGVPDGIVDDWDDKSALWRPVQQLLSRDYGAVLGQGVKAKVALHFTDVGSARSNINSHGNVQDSLYPYHTQSQGLSPFEVSLAGAIDALEMGISFADAAATAKGLVEKRLGEDVFPGIEGADEDLLNNPYNPLGNAYFDFAGDGTAENTAGWPSYDVEDESAEFNPEFPISDEPFGPFDMYDLVIRTNTVSQDGAATMLLGTPGLEEANLNTFTTRSGGTILAARSIRGPSIGAWDKTNTTVPGSLSGYAFLNPTGFALTTSRTTDEEVTLQRAIQDGLSGATDTDLYEFILALEPAVKGSSGADIASADAQNIIHQVAANLRDFIDVGSDGTPWGTGPEYVYGVEWAPYIAEVEAAIDTVADYSAYSFAPSISGDLPDWHDSDPIKWRLRAGQTLYYDAGSSGNYSVGDAVWIDNAGGTMGNYDEEDTLITGTLSGNEAGTAMDPVQNMNNPPTGWGKYIKLVNPWNKPIDLSEYKLVLPATYGDKDRLREWYFDTTDGKWHSRKHVSDITIALTGTVPARGHALIVDYVKTTNRPGPFDAFASSVLIVEKKEINYMQEADGGEDIVTDDFQDLPSSGPTVIELRKGSDVLMRFQVQETADKAGGAVDEDDHDDFITKFKSPNVFNFSTQIGDPRPCWWRDPTGTVAGGESVTGDPWTMGGANVQPTSFATWPGTTSSTQLGWFNTNWRGASDTEAVGSGDGWYKLNADSASDEPSNKNNLLHSFPPVDPCAAVDTDIYSGVTGEKIMDIGRMANPGYLGFVHAGVEWGTLSLGKPAYVGEFGEAERVYLRNFGDYLTGPLSPYEDDLDNDADSNSDESDTGIQLGDRAGPEVRRLGKVNVNTASEAVLRAVLSPQVLSGLMGYGEDPYARAKVLAEAIISKRDTDAPFSSVDDLLERVPELFGDSPPGPNSFQREAMARFMYNNVTVRSDVWAVVGRARLYSDANDDDVADPGEALADRRFYFVLDRSHDPIRVVAWRLLP